MTENINHRPIVGITQGDGNGIGYEIIIKSLADARILDSFTPVIYGSSKVFGYYRKTLHNIGPMDVFLVQNAREARPRKINIVNCLGDNDFVDPGKSTPEAAKAAILSLQRAVQEMKEGLFDVLVTAPINKKAMSLQGFGNTGHTDFLKQEFGADDALMFMISDQIKISIVTEHIPLKEVPAAITTEKILNKLRLMQESLKKDFGVVEPKIAVLGLNPHCGDGGLLGDEEERIIKPAVKAAIEEGIMAFGPYSPDGFFGLGHYAKFDATLAMYHDQGLAPFKALAFEDGVNFTAGLPIIRTSPDHGTAYEMAGRDEADPQSMMSAIYSAIDIFRRRSAYERLHAGKMKKEHQPISNNKPHTA